MRATMRTLSATLLLCVCLHWASAQGSRRPVPRPVPCCVEVSSAKLPSNIGAVSAAQYKRQTAKHPCVAAVILDSKRGRFCIDPAAPWLPGLVTLPYEGSVGQ